MELELRVWGVWHILGCAKLERRATNKGQQGGGLLLPDLNSNGSRAYPGRGQTGEKGPQGKLEMVSNRGTVRQQS